MGRENTTLSVGGMSCSHCENSIKKAVGGLKGVYEVRVDLAGKKVTVDYDPAQVNITAVREAIEDQGYDVY